MQKSGRKERRHYKRMSLACISTNKSTFPLTLYSARWPWSLITAFVCQRSLGVRLQHLRTESEGEESPIKLTCVRACFLLVFCCFFFYSNPNGIPFHRQCWRVHFIIPLVCVIDCVSTLNFYV